MPLVDAILKAKSANGKTAAGVGVAGTAASTSKGLASPGIGSGITDSGVAGAPGNPSSPTAAGSGVASTGMAGTGPVVAGAASAGLGAGQSVGGQAPVPVAVDPSYAEKAGKIGTQLESMDPFHYDPNSDASYQAYKKLYEADAAAGTQNTLETMGDRGIANSSITSTQIAKVQQNAMNQLNALIPQLEQNAYTRYEDAYQNKASLMSTYLNQGNSDREFQLQESDRTGKYVPIDIKTEFDQLTDLKTKATAKGVTAEQRAQYSAAADTIRAKLAAQGVDISQLGADSTLGTAQGFMNGYGTETLAAQNQKFNQGETTRVNDQNIKASDAGIQVSEAGVTGKYVPADVKAGFDALTDLKIKATAKNVTAEQRAAYSAQADIVRAQLAAKGVDISQLGADDTLGTAQSYISGYGTKTSAQQNTEFNQGETKRVNDQNIKASESSIANTTFNQGETKRMNDAQITSIGQSVANAKLDGVIKQQTANMNQWMIDNNLTPDMVNQATNGVLAKIAQTGSYDAAIKYVQDNAAQLAADGVDVSKIYSGIATMYPQAAPAKPDAGPDMVEINKQAITLAQADTIRWNKAKGDPVAQQAIIDEYKKQLLDGVSTGK